MIEKYHIRSFKRKNFSSPTINGICSFDGVWSCDVNGAQNMVRFSGFSAQAISIECTIDERKLSRTFTLEHFLQSLAMLCHFVLFQANSLQSNASKEFCDFVFVPFTRICHNIIYFKSTA